MLVSLVPFRPPAVQVKAISTSFAAGGHGSGPGSGGRVTRRGRVNLFDLPDGSTTVRHKLDVLHEHCEESGRPYDEIEKTLSTRLAPDDTVGGFVERCREQASWRIDHSIVIRSGPWTLESARILIAAVPAVAPL
jgi:hypothetical protein